MGRQDKLTMFVLIECDIAGNKTLLACSHDRRPLCEHASAQHLHLNMRPLMEPNGFVQIDEWHQLSLEEVEFLT